eukprot:gene18321-20142_t
MKPDMKKANEISQLKGASSWLSSLPLKSQSFSLDKREFYDSIRLRYRWRLKLMSSTCVCGKPYNGDHAMACQRGGYIHHRHNEIRDLFIKLAEEISNDVECEPQLQPLGIIRIFHTTFHNTYLYALLHLNIIIKQSFFMVLPMSGIVTAENCAEKWVVEIDLHPFTPSPFIDDRQFRLPTLRMSRGQLIWTCSVLSLEVWKFLTTSVGFNYYLARFAEGLAK